MNVAENRSSDSALLAFELDYASQGSQNSYI